MINDPGNQLVVSAISLWEFRLHIRRGRIEVVGDPNTWIAQTIALMQVEVAPIRVLKAFERFQPTCCQCCWVLLA